MSDADNQTGGTGGETGPQPDEVSPGKDNAAPPKGPDHREGGDEDTDADSFPASDPPATY